jgi:hypothetical protein
MESRQAVSGSGQHYWAATGCEFQINLFGFGLLSKALEKALLFFPWKKLRTHAGTGFTPMLGTDNKIRQ